MEQLNVTSKVITAQLEQVDTESMADFNAAVEGRKRVRLVFSALSENDDATTNAFQSWCASHTTNALYSVILNLDNMKNTRGILLSDDEVKTLVWEQAKKAHNVLQLTIVNVPICCALEGVQTLYTTKGIRVSVRTVAYIGTADQTATALASVAARLEKDVANGILFKEDPTATTTDEQTIVG